MDWTDVQITIVVQNFASFGNAAKAKSDGAEASLEIKPVDNFTIGVRAAYINARLTSDAPSISARNGDPLPFSPKFTAVAATDYRLPLSNALTLNFGATYAYRGAQRTGFSSAGRISLPSYGSLDLRAGLDWSRFSLIARVDNVTNKFAVTSAQTSFAGGAPLIGNILRPRTFALSVQARF